MQVHIELATHISSLGHLWSPGYQSKTEKMSTLPKCMKVLIKEEEKPSYIYKDIPVPQPNTGELLVKVLKVSICGSDTILYQWNEGNAQHI